MGKRDNPFQCPSPMQPIQRAGGKGIPGAIRPPDIVRRHLHRWCDRPRALSCHGNRATGEMHDDKLHRAGIKHRQRVGKAGIDIGILPMSDRPVGDGGDLELVDDQVVKMRKAGRHDAMKPFGGKRTHFEIRFQAGRLRGLQNGHPAIRIILPGRIHLRVKPRQSKMKNARATV